ncbi:MAG: TonB-dependent receptor, partial [Muribaculaceae bacterium]|nr:TonB-dependent receptor [Muribaculaceae bacterium]
MSNRLFISMLMAAAGAATVSAAVVRGRVADTDKEPLPGASVSLLSATDSAFVAGVSTNARGAFVFPKVKKGKYIVKADFIGYSTATSNVTVKTDNDTIRVGRLDLAQSSIMLDEAVAIGIATPVKVMEDTIQYAASAYKTPPNAVVEDLLKRLPGVEVDKSTGGITAQGQKVAKILLDGEEFFSDDPTIASKNLPVNMVENAQVITRKSDLARLTGVDDGEDETVINLTIKKGMKRGWNGTVEAGYGTDDRWKAIFNVIGMRDKNQFAILGNFNNVNEQGFGDKSGGRFRRAGGMQNGINTSQSLGFNFTLANNDKLRFGGELLWAHSDRYNRQDYHRLNILHGIDNSTEDGASRSNDRGHNVRANFRLLWEPDSFNTMEFRPTFSYFLSDSESDSYTENNLGQQRTAQSRNLSSSSGHGYDFGGRLIYSHKFKNRRGRSFSVSANYSLSDNREKEPAWSRNAFWLNDSLYEDYQLIESHNWNNGINARVSWVEPLGNVKRGNFLEFSYMMNYRWNNADKDVMHHPWSESHIPDDIVTEWQAQIWRDWTMADRLTGLDPALMVPDSAGINSFRNDYFSQSIRVGYKKVNAKYTLNAGIGFNPSMSKSVNLSDHRKDQPARHVWNYAPFVRFNYKFTKQSSANINYFGRSSQPSLTQLQPVTDNSDPMNVIKGNPNLDPSFTHSLRARFQFYNPDKQQSIMVMAFGSLTQNAIASKMTYDPTTGARVTEYENVNGVWEGTAMTMYSRPLRNKMWTVNNFLRLNANRQVGYVSSRINRSTRLGLSESFGIAFRPSDLEVELRPRYTLSTIRNTISTNSDNTTHTYGASLNATYYTPIGLVLATDLNYSNTRGYSDGYDPEEWMWNASLSYMFLRDKSATIALKAYDLLQQRKSISRSETAQAITDVSFNTLTRYVMLTFTYKFNTYKKRSGSGNGDF